MSEENTKIELGKVEMIEIKKSVKIPIGRFLSDDIEHGNDLLEDIEDFINSNEVRRTNTPVQNRLEGGANVMPEDDENKYKELFNKLTEQ
jgi:hypothetical protein